MVHRNLAAVWVLGDYFALQSILLAAIATHG